MVKQSDQFVNNSQYEEDKAAFIRVDEREKFADTFAECAEKQTAISKTISKTLLQNLSSDVETKKQLKIIISEVLKEDSKAMFKRFGSWVIGIINIAVGAIITLGIQAITKLV